MSFEEEFSESQIAMVQLALNLTDGRIDDVFVYTSCEGGSTAFNVCFGAGENVLKTNELNQLHSMSSPPSDDEIFGVLSQGLDLVDEMEAICEHHNQPIPTESRLHYDLRAEKLVADFKYDPVFVEGSDWTPHEEFNEWVAQLHKDYSKRT